MLYTVLSIVGTVALTIFIACAQKYLSTRRAWQMGAVMPALSVLVMGVLLVSKDMLSDGRAILVGVIIIALECLIWADGRRELRRSELVRMKARDI